jgi:hypothetical protein
MKCLDSVSRLGYSALTTVLIVAWAAFVYSVMSSGG